MFALNCQYCKSDHLRRSRRRANDGVGPLLFCKAYRCLACEKRFFRLSIWRLLGAAVTVALVLTIDLAIEFVQTLEWPE